MGGYVTIIISPYYWDPEKARVMEPYWFPLTILTPEKVGVIWAY